MTGLEDLPGVLLEGESTSWGRSGAGGYPRDGEGAELTTTLGLCFAGRTAAVLLIRASFDAAPAVGLGLGAGCALSHLPPGTQEGLGRSP